MCCALLTTKRYNHGAVCMWHGIDLPSILRLIKGFLTRIEINRMNLTIKLVVIISILSLVLIVDKDAKSVG